MTPETYAKNTTMQTTQKTVLIGEDEIEVRGYLEMALKCLGYSVESAQDGDEVLSCLQSFRSEICAVLLDLTMPNRDGFDTLREIRRIRPNLPVIVISGDTSTLSVVGAMRTGATDYLSKPVLHEQLREALARAMELPGRPAPAQRGVVPAGKTAFVSGNARMKQIHALVTQIGWSEAPVLIQGETGSGKEVIARDLHAHSPRANKPLLKLNCAALPSELVESELFGYERGAFTGALQKKAGMFEIANGGTILLDEIGDMDVRLQAKLLQVLQDQEFQRIGGKDTVKVDVRVMAATHRDLEKSIAENSFREDLYYRLNVINVVLPPLRERTEDIVPMAEFLMKRHVAPGLPLPQLTPELKRAMTAYRWPGNVRELENAMRKFLILGDAHALTRELETKTSRKAAAPAVQPLVAPPAQETPAPAPAVAAPAATGDASSILEQVTKAKMQAESDTILAVLNSTRWNRKRAAKLLNIDYKALLYKMKKLGIDDKPAPFIPVWEPPASILSACGD
jgi:two-component system, NtrC family, response regulator AtoC